MMSTVPRKRRPRAAGEGIYNKIAESSSNEFIIIVGDQLNWFRNRVYKIKLTFAVFVTSRSSIYLATGQAEQPTNPNDQPPLYENSGGGGSADEPQRPKRRQRRTNDEEASGTKRSHAQTICRSVSFLQKKTYQECFNSAIEKQLKSTGEEEEEKGKKEEDDFSSTTAVKADKEDSKEQSKSGAIGVQTTDGVEWEFQDLSLYLGSLFE